MKRKQTPEGQLPRKESAGEAAFALHCRLELPPALQPIREYVPFPPRKWRLDFSWPERKLAVEIESSVHRIQNRFASDLEKYNRLNIEGWTLLRYTRKMVETAEAIDTVKKVLRTPPPQ